MPFELPEDARTARRGAITRWVTFALVAILVALLAYLGYVGFVGSEQLANPPAPSHDCRTPAIGRAWVYEAVNYDPGTDLAIADLDDPRNCPDREPLAGGALTASDGVRLAAWYIPAGNGSPPSGPTVVLAHGYGRNKSTMLPIADVLHQRYNLVLFDFRNHGQSGGSQTTQGLREATDLRAMLDWLRETKKPDGVAVLGVSMGAAAALSEAVGDEEVDALILDSMHATLANAIQARLDQQHYPLSLPAAWAILLGGLLRTGQDMSAVDPISQIDRVHRPVLIIQAGLDDTIGPTDSQDLLAAARRGGADAEMEVCHEAGHGESIERCRAAYADWVLGFLERNLGR